MPKRTSPETRSAIRALFKKGWTKSKISSELEVDWKTVDRWVKSSTLSDKPRRVVKISPQKVGVFRRQLKSGQSLRRVGRKSGVSHETVRKRVRKSKSNPTGLFPYKNQYTLRLTQKQRVIRQEYCDTFPNTDRAILNRVKKRVFYDEKPFYLGQMMNKQNNRIWTDSKSDVKSKRVVKDKNPTMVHSFATISYNQKSDLFFFGHKSKYVKGVNKGVFDSDFDFGL